MPSHPAHVSHHLAESPQAASLGSGGRSPFPSTGGIGTTHDSPGETFPDGDPLTSDLGPEPQEGTGQVPCSSASNGNANVVSNLGFKMPLKRTTVLSLKTFF